MERNSNYLSTFSDNLNYLVSQPKWNTQESGRDGKREEWKWRKGEKKGGLPMATTPAIPDFSLSLRNQARSLDLRLSGQIPDEW